MKVFFHEDFYQEYTSDPAAAPGRMESILNVIEGKVDIVEAKPANAEDIAAIHTPAHIESVRRSPLYPIAVLAAGGAVQAAVEGLTSPASAMIRPPGHHASPESCWGFCYFSNMAIAISHLKRNNLIRTAYILDFDLHYGDGTVNSLLNKDYVTIYNPDAPHRETYLTAVKQQLDQLKPDTADIIGISAGFDNHEDDWGNVLKTEDYVTMGRWVRHTALKNNGGCFAVLEGGYNHDILGHNAFALIKGLSS